MYLCVNSIHDKRLTTQAGYLCNVNALRQSSSPEYQWLKGVNTIGYHATLVYFNTRAYFLTQLRMQRYRY